MAKIHETGEVVAEATTGRTVYVVKNMDVGNRDYPLTGGGTLYLPMKKKGVAWPEIKGSQISAALRKAEATGHVKITKKEVK